jgi:carbon storage regulator CsrA
MSVSVPAPAAPSRAPSDEALGHLVISRRESESVQIGDDVVVEILAVEGSTVRLRITAPKSVRILRRELGSR